METDNSLTGDRVIWLLDASNNAGPCPLPPQRRCLQPTTAINPPLQATTSSAKPSQFPTFVRRRHQPLVVLWYHLVRGSVSGE